jgi:hypothetical protein
MRKLAQDIYVEVNLDATIRFTVYVIGLVDALMD